MSPNLQRSYLVELVGTFGLVYFSAAVVCMNYLAVPSNQPLGTTPLTLHQSGLLGIALAQGLIYAVLLALTVPFSGGYLNPAVSLSLWAFNRLESRRLAWLLGAQLLGSFFAATVLRYSFQIDLLTFAHFGTPHVNLLAYHELTQSSLYGGLGIELVLTFFLVFAIFGLAGDRLAFWSGGAVYAAAVLVSFPVTGACLNPARWFGPVIWETWVVGSVLNRSPFADMLVYLAGPILGALLGGAFCFLFYLPGLAVRVEPAAPAKVKK